MTGNEIRSKFCEFFKSKNHKVTSSDSLVPKDDPTVLFTTAGMQQFKPQFMGHITDFTRAVSAQKCLRTDDLPEVGVTDFHHTMFEMLGNFSFGDYFKQEAVQWAWEFLTITMKLPSERLWVSVNVDDKETYAIWRDIIKVPVDRIVKLGDKSNFWPSNARLNGPNGPCGPCSEIFYDWGKADCRNPKGCDPDCSCGRFCEVWNLVFTQFNRKEGGELDPLPAQNIDTGMGLERLTAVVQGKRNNFETDIFSGIIAGINAAVAKEGTHLSLRETRVVADHIRAVTFGLSDGVIPSNEGRGYVMRRLIVDVVNIMIMAGIRKPMVHAFVADVVMAMKEPYPELILKEREIVQLVLRVEEAVIRLNVEKVPEFIEDIGLLKAGGSPQAGVLGELMFRYRDTYGLSFDFIKSKIKEVFGDEHLALGLASAQQLMDIQKERSRAASKMQGDVFLSGDLDVKGIPVTSFVGYEQPSIDARILAIYVNGERVPTAFSGDQVAVVLDSSPFYPEQGGQVADTGYLRGKKGSVTVTSTQKYRDVLIHRGKLEGTLQVDETWKASIDGERRMAIMRNHTATHLLQSALRQVLGEHVKQQGSLVDENRLRFDFTNPKALTREECEHIEDVVNVFIRRCDPVIKKTMSIEEARQSGALAFFAEKYGDTVRIVSCGDVSKEFCGGTHLDSTGQIGVFKILSEGAVAQGIRRIEALTGPGAWQLIRSREKTMEMAASILKSPVDDLVSRVEAQVKRIKDLQKETSHLNFEIIKSSIDNILTNVSDINGIAFIGHHFPGLDRTTLRQVSDFIKQKRSSAIIVLAATSQDEGSLIVVVTDDLVKNGIKAGDLINKVTPLFGGSGGGRPQLAQAGCNDPQRLAKVFDNVQSLIKESLGV